MRRIDKIVDQMDENKVETMAFGIVMKMARFLRLQTVQLLYDNGDLTLEEAQDVLRGKLSPNDEDSKYDDSALLKA